MHKYILVKYFTPATAPVESLGFGEEFDVSFDEEAIRHIFSNTMYREPTAGLRELYANAVNACKTAKEQGADSYIEININLSTLKLEMTEHDSMGITKDVFKNVYCVLGRSGNFDGEKPGQFGIGMLAYYALSETMLLESYSRETGEQFTVLGRNARRFEDLTSENQPTMDSYGTKITLSIRAEPDKTRDIKKASKNVISNLISALNDYARFSGVKTVIKTAGHIENGNYPAERVFENETAEGYFGEKPIFTLENEDYKLDIMKWRNFDKNMITLAGMPIQDQKLKLPCNAYLLQVKNEREYVPMASRDGFSAGAIEKLEKKIPADIINSLKGRNYSFADCIIDKPILKMLSIININRPGLLEEIAPKLSLIINTINKPCLVYEKTDDSYRRYKTSPLTLFLGKSMHSYGGMGTRHVEAVMSGGARCMERGSPSVVEKYFKIPDDQMMKKSFKVIYVPRGNKEEILEEIENMKKLGIPKLDIPVKKRPVKKKGIILHYASKGKLQTADFVKGMECIKITSDERVMSCVKKLSAQNIDDVMIYKAKDNIGTTQDMHAKYWDETPFTTIDGKVLTGGQVLSSECVLISNDDPLCDKITVDIWKTATDGDVIDLIKCSQYMINQLAARAILDDVTPPKRFAYNQPYINSVAKTAYGITGSFPAPVWTNHIDDIKDLLERVKENELRNIIIECIEKTRKAEFLVEEIKDSLQNYDGVINGCLCLLKDVNESTLFSSNKTRFKNVIMEKLVNARTGEMREELLSVIKKEYFPYGKKVEFTDDGGFATIMKITISKDMYECINTKDLRREEYCNFIPDSFKSLEITKDDIIVTFYDYRTNRTYA